MVLSKSLILRFFCRFVGKNVTKFLCYIDLLKVTKLTRLARTGPGGLPRQVQGNRVQAIQG